jgi:hypothetical protein
MCLGASSVRSADGVSAGFGFGAWRFTAPSAEFRTVLGESPSALTGCVFVHYGQGATFLALRVGYMKKELPKGFRVTRAGQRVMVDDPSSLRIVPVTLEFGLEGRRRTRPRVGLGLGVASLRHHYLPSPFVHPSSDEHSEVTPVVRLAAGVASRRGHATVGAEASYFTLVQAQSSVTKVAPEAYHAVSLELQIGFH